MSQPYAEKSTYATIWTHIPTNQPIEIGDGWEVGERVARRASHDFAEDCWRGQDSDHVECSIEKPSNCRESFRSLLMSPNLSGSAVRN